MTTEAAPARPSAPDVRRGPSAVSGSARQRLFRLHRWLGLHLGLVLFVICFTGTIATMSPQIDWLIHPEMRVTPGGEPLPWQTLVDRVREAYPDEPIGQIEAPAGPRSAARVTLHLPVTPEWADGSRTLHLDPYTGEILGQTNPFLSIQHFLRLFHKQFFIYGTWVPHGILIVGAFAFALLVSVLSGFVSYRTWFRNLLTLRAGSPRRLLSDLHRLIGIWALFFSLIIALTGLWYFADRALESAGVGSLITESVAVDVDASEVADAPRMISIEAAIARAEAAIPGFELGTALLPSAPDDPIVLSARPEGPFQNGSANAVFLHPFSGEVLDVRTASGAGVVNRVSQLINPLHFGDFGGLWTRSLWFLLGLALSASILIGFRMWFLRTAGRSGRPSMGPQGVAALAATLTIVAAASYHTYIGIQLRWPAETAELVQHFEGPIGPWTAHVTRERPVDGSSLALVTVRLSGTGGGVANYRSARVGLAGNPTESTSIRPFLAGERVRLPVEGSAPPRPLLLRVTGWGGEDYELRIPAVVEGAPGPSLRRIDGLAIRPGVVAVSLAILFAILGIIGWWMSMMYARQTGQG